MKMSQVILLFSCLLLVRGGVVHAADIIIENNTAKIIFDATTGKLESLLAKGSNTELTANSHIDFFRIRVGEKEYPGTSIVQTKDLLTVSFGSAEIEIDFKIITKRYYFTLELVEIRGGNVESVWLGRLDIKLPKERLGRDVAVKWNDKQMIGWIPLSQRVHVLPIGAKVYRKHGLIGIKTAFFISATSDWGKVLQQIKEDHQLPTTTIAGEWSKHSKDVQHGYLFVNLNEKNVQRMIAAAKRAGLKYILIYSDTWSSSVGSYQINTKNYSRGEATLKEVVDQCHDAGLKVGIHVLIDSVAKNDPLATPTPDYRLLKDNNGNLVEKYGRYVVNLKTTLKDKIADRLAGLINRIGFDMIYFDGVGAGAEPGEHWRWSGDLPVAVTNRVKRDLLVQGSSFSPWSWHISSRGTCNDFSTLAVKEHTDYTKLHRYRQYYESNLLPAELGWWALVSASNSFPATTSDQVEFIGSRMMAYDIPISVETHEQDFDVYGRTDEMLGLLGLWEKHRLSGTVPRDVRKQLKNGDWHLEVEKGHPIFYPREYHKVRVRSFEDVKVNNRYNKQPLMFRLQATPELALPGNPDNIILHDQPNADTLARPGKNDPMPGYAIAKDMLSHTDLSDHRSLAITLQVDSDIPMGVTPVLNVQLETGSGYPIYFRDYLVDIDFSGKKVVVVEDSTAGRVFKDFRPKSINYNVLRANRYFNYKDVKKVNYRWMRLAANKDPQVRVLKVEALKEKKKKLSNPTVYVRGRNLTFPVQMSTGDYLEYFGSGAARHYDENFNLLGHIKPIGDFLWLSSGVNSLLFSAEENTPIRWTTIIQGKPINNLKNSA